MFEYRVTRELFDAWNKNAALEQESWYNIVNLTENRTKNVKTHNKYNITFVIKHPLEMVIKPSYGVEGDTGGVGCFFSVVAWEIRSPGHAKNAGKGLSYSPK